MRFVLLFVLLTYSFSINAQKRLLPIVENGLNGFIDTTGKVVIVPKFKTIHLFSEGVAAAREGGRFGYIDSTGNWTILPQYDYATVFVEGLAIVFKKGRPFYINHKGETPFAVDSAKTLTHFKNGLAKIEIGKHTYILDEKKQPDYVYQKTFGLMNKSGKWLVQPIYESIFDFDKDLFKVVDYSSKNSQRTEGVIDEHGNWLMPLGIYSEISDFKNGYAKVDFLQKRKKKWGGDEGFVNRKGETIFRLKSSQTLGIGYDAFVEDSIFVIRRGKMPKKSEREKGVSWSSEWSYEGLMNLKGEILLDSFHITNIEPIGRGIFKIRDRKYSTYFVDKFGKQIGFDIRPSKSTKEADIKMKNDVALARIAQYLKDEEEKTDETKVDTTPKEMAYFLSADTTGRLNYSDNYNNVIWQAKTITSTIDTLDVDYMTRGDFYAHSDSKANDRGYGGWGGSGNGTDSITQQMYFLDNQFVINIRTSDTVHLGRWLGYKVFIANNTLDTFHFTAQDSRLSMNIQALDSANQWRDIQYLPSSWCGNSYHTLALDPQRYWQFTMPLFKGSMPTRLRLKLKIKEKKEGGKEYELFSNEIKASVNPAQFWRKENYSPNGIMDPYND